MSEADEVISVTDAPTSDAPMRMCRICKTVQPMENFKYKTGSSHSTKCHTCRDNRKFTTRIKSARINDVDYKAVAEGIKRCPIAPAAIKPYIPNRKESGVDPKRALFALHKQNDMLKKAFLNAYEQLSGIGMTDADLVRLFGISETGLTSIKRNDLEGNEAWQAAMKNLQTKLAAQLLVHGLGFDYEESKSVYEPVTDEVTGEVTYKEKKKEVWKRHYNGDPGLLEFYMVNRFPDLWKKSSELITRKAEGYDSDPADRTRKQIESFARDVLAQHPEGAESEYRVPVEATLISDDSRQTGEK